MSKRDFIVRWTAGLMLSVLLLGGCASTGQSNSSVQDGVFVHIKSGPDQAHSVLMGLRMAQMMSADRDVLVYFDVDGIEVVLKDAPDLQMAPLGSSQAMLKDLLTRRVPVYACPGCLKAAGKTPEQLAPGVQVAQKEAFFRFTQGRILTLDY
ncbi:MAG: DsrE family protein [Phycisphaeraceae bacterium]|nr:DsrE family protein [Phycisphaeraceae bacterium]